MAVSSGVHNRKRHIRGRKAAARNFSKDKSRRTGCVLAAAVTVLSAAVPAVILAILYHLSWIAGFAVETFFCYQLLATKSLKQESGKV
mgnify:CR=1 FL=1